MTKVSIHRYTFPPGHEEAILLFYMMIDVANLI